jgi:hypothetical protein
MRKNPIWTREYTSQRLDEFYSHVRKWKGRTAIGEWHDHAGIPRDSLNHYSKKYGMKDRYREAVQLIRKANRRRGW